MTKAEIEADIAALARAIKGEPKTLFVSASLFREIKRLGVEPPKNVAIRKTAPAAN